MQIHFLAARGDIEGVKRQLDAGDDVNAPMLKLSQPVSYFYPTQTPLIMAAGDPRAGFDMLELLISRGADPDIIDSQDNTALMRAAKSGSLEKTRFLLHAGANARLRTRHGYTPLISAAYSPVEQLQIVELLLKTGVKPHAAPYRHPNETAIRVAHLNNKFKMIKLLLNAGVDQRDLNWSDLSCAIVYGSVDDIQQQLRRNEVTEIDVINWMLCLRVGDLQRTQLLMEKGVERAQEAELFAALAHDTPELFQWLIDHGAHLNSKDQWFESTLLMEAAQRGATQCMRILIEQGANVNAQNKYNATAINYASTPEAVKLLVESGARINHIDGEGYSRLKQAAEEGDLDITKTLLELGADPDASNTGQTPLHKATLNDQLEIARMLLDAGADPNAEEPDGWTPLMNAVTVDGAQLLLDYGANITIRTIRSKDESNYPEIERFLWAKLNAKG